MTLVYHLERESHIPLYIQLASQIRRSISEGVLKIGDPLPTTRELAEQLTVNRNTVTAAYAELVADGLISSHVGRGTFVSAIPAERKSIVKENYQPSPMPWDALLTDQRRDGWLEGMARAQEGLDTISLAYALPSPELFPLEDFRRCSDRVLRKEGRSLLQLGNSKGYQPLREYVAGQMALLGYQTKLDEILITSGCQQAIDLVRRILVGPGDEVAIENPTYPGVLSIFCGGDARYISVPVTEQGLDLNVLEDIFAQRRPKLLYTIPSFHNPTGVTMDINARHRLIELAARYRVPIIEDDIYRELRYEGPALPPLKALDQYGLVIYISSISKIGFPGLRVGWVVADSIVIEQINAIKQRTDLHTNLIAQASIYEFSRHGLLARHIKRVKKEYSQRRDTMLAALMRYFPDEVEWNQPDGGMAIWLKLPATFNTGQLLIQASEKGVSFSPGEFFYASQPQHNMLRLSFSMSKPPLIEEGIKRLSAIIKERLTRIKRQRGLEQNTNQRALV